MANDIFPRQNTPLHLSVVSERPMLAHALTHALDGYCEVACFTDPAGIDPAEETHRIIVLDQALSAIETLQDLVKRFEGGVIAWLPCISPEVGLSVLQEGVRGILEDRSSIEDILACLKALRHGGSWVPAEVSSVLLTRKICRLSPRDAQVITLLTSGLRNKEIAHAMGITEGTVKVYLSKIFTKLGVSDRFELALFALRSMGLIAARSEGRDSTVGSSHWHSQEVPRSVFPMARKEQWWDDDPSAPHPKGGSGVLLH